MPKKSYPGGFRLTLKTARALVVQEFGTAKGLEPDRGTDLEGYFRMQLLSLDWSAVDAGLCPPGGRLVFETGYHISDFYVEFQDSRPIISYWGQDWTVPEPSMAEYDSAGIFESAKSFSDTALIVLARSGGEGADLPTSYYVEEDTFSPSGNGLWGGAGGLRMSAYPEDMDPSKTYLEPTTRELQLIERVSQEFSNVIVVTTL